MMSEKKILSVGWLSTGNGEGSIGLLNQGVKLVDSKKIKINYVFSNREYGEKNGSDNFIDFVKKSNLKMLSFSSAKYKKEKKLEWVKLREEYDRKVLSIISNYKVDIIVAAGYMLFSPIICNHYKILNIHPALPNGPNGTWKNVIKSLINSKSDKTGISIHKMTPDLDEGPNISYCEFKIKINENDFKGYSGKSMPSRANIETSSLFVEIRKKMVKYEQILLLKTLEKISEGEINLEEDTLINLTDEIKQLLY